MNKGSPIVALTPGEPAGIGPDLAVGLATRDLPLRLIVVADADMLRHRALALGVDLEVRQD
ncbi:MAG: 4-hydroxythreonine-4-phosphate dehydrogenase, partial [Chromatiales bacterium]|nr:4-hydroxythreonine-4-phosphate dehydrogenase [Chromatiales bacterium]